MPFLRPKENYIAHLYLGTSLFCKADSHYIRTGAVGLCGGLAVKLTPGKLAGMKAVSNENGVIAAAAMDQRGSLKKVLGTRATDEGSPSSSLLLPRF